jgi:3-hydroxybutyryl-CoA dehydrogenase
MSMAATPPVEPAAPLRVTVSGAGLMGHGIALVFATAGHRVRLHDALPAALTGVADRIRVSNESIGGNPAVLQRISLHERLDAAVDDADFVVEAIPERLDVKRAFFAEVERFAPPAAILCSNTSALPIAAIGAQLRAPQRFIGTHWWNPPHLIPLVEVIASERTAPAVIERCMQILREAGKLPVQVRRDVPGFIGNRLQHALWREALALVEAGICDAETVDLVVKNSFGIRLAVLGPLENADLVGLDLTRDIHATLLEHLDASTAPSPLLDTHIARGELGMKSGRGLREWTPAAADAVRNRLREHLMQARRDRHDGTSGPASPALNTLAN